MADEKKPSGGGNNRSNNAGRKGNGGGDLFAGSGGLFLFLIVLAAIFFSTKSAGVGSKNGINVGSPSKVGTVEENLSAQKSFSNYFYSSSNNSNSYSGSYNNSNNNTVTPVPQISTNESIYKNKVSISPYGGMNTDPKQEYIDIYYSLYSSQEKIPVTGWTIENSKGNKFAIGSANYLAQSGTGAESPIQLGSGDILHIITGPSPTGENFRTNLCTGYFNQYHNFMPSIREECPRPEKENSAQNLENQCYNFLKTLSACREPANPANKVDTTCQNYVNQEISYSKCVQAHQNEKDFYKNEWYVYLGRTAEIWKYERETVTLRDQAGKIIASYSY